MTEEVNLVLSHVWNRKGKGGAAWPWHPGCWPVDGGSGGVALLDQGLDFPPQLHPRRGPLPEAGAGGTLNSISAMFSQLPCFGVKWNSSRLAIRRASAAGKASYRDAIRWVFRLSQTTRTTASPDRLRPLASASDGRSPASCAAGSLPHGATPPAAPGQEQVAGPLPPVLVLPPAAVLAGPATYRSIWFVSQQTTGLDGVRRRFQHILHIRHEVGAHPGDAPRLPRLESVFFVGEPPHHGCRQAQNLPKQATRVQFMPFRRLWPTPTGPFAPVCCQLPVPMGLHPV